MSKQDFKVFLIRYIDLGSVFLGDMPALIEALEELASEIKNFTGGVPGER